MAPKTTPSAREIRRIAQSLAAEGNMPDLPCLYQDVLLRRTSLESAAAALQDPTHRQLAYEMAVCVCDVDGRQTPTEREFGPSRADPATGQRSHRCL